jgi:hypothetical protein
MAEIIYEWQYSHTENILMARKLLPALFLTLGAILFEMFFIPVSARVPKPIFFALPEFFSHEFWIELLVIFVYFVSFFIFFVIVLSIIQTIRKIISKLPSSYRLYLDKIEITDEYNRTSVHYWKEFKCYYPTPAIFGTTIKLMQSNSFLPQLYPLPVVLNVTENDLPKVLDKLKDFLLLIDNQQFKKRNKKLKVAVLLFAFVIVILTGITTYYFR